MAPSLRNRHGLALKFEMTGQEKALLSSHFHMLIVHWLTRFTNLQETFYFIFSLAANMICSSILIYPILYES